MGISFRFGLVAVLALQSLAHASSITGTEANVNFIYTGSNTTPCFETNEAAPGCDGSVAVPATTATLNYESYGIATYGVLGAFAQGSVTAGTATTGTIPNYANLNSTAYFVDSFTFNGTDTCGGVSCAATGSGTIQMQFIIAGTVVSSGDAFGNVCMDIQSGNNPGALDCTVAAGALFPTGPGLIVSQKLPVTFGQAATYTIGLETYGHILSFTGANASFTSNFANTATLAGFEVEDASGNPLSSFSVTSQSETTYADGTLPEPSSLLMLVGAMALLAAWRLRLNRISVRISCRLNALRSLAACARKRALLLASL